MSDASSTLEMSNHLDAAAKRPLSVTIIAWLFIATGTVGLIYHGGDFKRAGAFQYELVLVCVIRLLAIICGVFLLRGRNWARWGLLIWIAYHVVLSVFHTLFELAMHSLLLAVVAWFLLRPKVSAYFRAKDNNGGPKGETTKRTQVT